MDRKTNNKNYYEAHREEILKRINERIWCDACETGVLKHRLSKHRTTNKHINNVAKQAVREKEQTCTCECGCHK